MLGDNILIGNVTLDNFLIFIFIIFIIVVSGNLSYALIRRMLDNRVPIRNSKSIAKFIQYTIFIIGIFYGVNNVLRYDINALVASLGIIGIAVAFGSQQIIQNFIAGILISIGRPVQLDDWVEIGDSGICNIKDITLTRTILRNKNGKIYLIPNSVLISSIIINYTKSGIVEISIPVSVPNGCNIENVNKIIMNIAHEHENILPNVFGEEKDIISKLFELPHIKILFKEKINLKIFEPKILVSGISDSMINLSIRFWIREIQKKDEIISGFFMSLSERFKEEKIYLK
jgi:small conductance mechanosensitive channel